MTSPAPPSLAWFLPDGKYANVSILPVFATCMTTLTAVGIDVMADKKHSSEKQKELVKHSNFLNEIVTMASVVTTYVQFLNEGHDMSCALKHTSILYGTFVLAPYASACLARYLFGSKLREGGKFKISFNFSFVWI